MSTDTVGSQFPVGGRAITMNDDGTFVATWTSPNGSDGSGFYEAFARRFNAAGTAVGPTIRVSAITTHQNANPAIASDANGNFVITWADPDGSESGIRAQRYNAAGVAQGSEFRVNTLTTDLQASPIVAMDADGDFVITWDYLYQVGPDVFTAVRGQRYSAAGAPQGSEFVVTPGSTSNISFSNVAMDDDGDFAVTWAGADGNSYGIFAQRYNAAGTAQGSAFRVNTFTNSGQAFSDIAMDADGDFVVTWRSYQQDGSSYGIYAQRYTSTGAPAGSEFRVNTTTSDGQIEPNVSMASNGDFVITWSSFTGIQKDIFSQAYLSNGQPLGSQFRVNTFTAQNQGAPTVAVGAGGNFVVLWESFSQDGDGSGVYAQRYSGLNNSAPTITSNAGGGTAVISFAENTATITNVTTVTATDPESAVQTLSYSISGGADAEKFTINSTSGELRFVTSPNFEFPTDVGADNGYNVTVHVSDGAGGTDTQQLQVNVTNVNDPPVITNNNSQTSAFIAISENSTAVTTITVSDEDQPAQTLSFSLSGGSASFFSINSTGQLAFITAPDYEAGAFTFFVNVHVSDGNGGTDFLDWRIQILNVNEPPVITSNGGADTVSLSRAENVTNLTPVLDLSATDPDALSVVSFSISGGADAARFTINSSTGQLFFAAVPNFESPADAGANNVYDVIVAARDQGGLTDTQSVAITVQDANDPPVITNNGGASGDRVLVPENTTAVTDVDATDEDAGSSITYSISGGADASFFSIDNSTGVLTFNAPPDYEDPADLNANNNYTIIVQARDNIGAVATQPLAILVTNVNERPTITHIGTSSGYTSRNENATSVTTVTVTDPDAGDTFSYSISGGADATAFSINSTTGELSFVSPPNFESPTDANTDNRYEVEITVEDAGGLTHTRPASVRVLDVNEPPAITSDGGGGTAALTLDENSAVVTTVTATDQDAPSTQTYSISGGADASLFSIDSDTGELQFNPPPDFENPADAGADNIYNVTVQVSDGTLTDTQDLTITVTDINEAPVITSDGGGTTAAVNVAENTTAVTTVTATDQDAGSSQTYSISGGADAAFFSINANTGELAFLAAPNFEKPKDAGKNNVYDVQVTVTDGSLTDTQDIAVTVTNVNESFGNLKVTGAGILALFEPLLPNEAYDFDIVVNPGGATFTGRDGTTINGQSTPQTFVGVNSLLGFLTEARRDDRIRISGTVLTTTLYVWQGSNEIEFNNYTSQGLTHVWNALGHSQLTATNSTFQALTFGGNNLGHFQADFNNVTVQTVTNLLLNGPTNTVNMTNFTANGFTFISSGTGQLDFSAVDSSFRDITLIGGLAGGHSVEFDNVGINGVNTVILSGNGTNTVRLDQVANANGSTNVFNSLGRLDATLLDSAFRNLIIDGGAAGNHTVDMRRTNVQTTNLLLLGGNNNTVTWDTVNNTAGFSTIISGAGTLQATSANNQLGSLTVIAGGTTNNQFSVRNTQVAGPTFVNLGGNSARLSVEDSHFAGLVSALLTGNNALVQIEHNASNNVDTQFDAAVTLTLGGTAQLNISPSNTSDDTTFASTLSLFAGLPAALLTADPTRLHVLGLLTKVNVTP